MKRFPNKWNAFRNGQERLTPIVPELAIRITNHHMNTDIYKQCNGLNDFVLNGIFHGVNISINVSMTRRKLTKIKFSQTRYQQPVPIIYEPGVQIDKYLTGLITI